MTRPNLQDLARVGVACADRMRLVAADLKKGRMRPQLKDDGAKAQSEGADADAQIENQKYPSMHQFVGCFQ